MSAVQYEYESRIVRWLRYFTIATLLVVILFPVFWLYVSSLKPPGQLFTSPPELFPDRFTLQHYHEVLSGKLIFYINSFFVSTVSTTIAIALAVMAGYGWGKFEFQGSHLTSRYVLLNRTFPLVVLVFPIFTTFVALNMLNTYIGLIIAYFALTVPLSAWLLKGFCENIPDSLLQAGRIDGLSEIQIFYRIVLPLIRPGIVATWLFAFLLTYQDLLFALSIMQKREKYTVPIELLKQIGLFDVSWGALLAMSGAYILPVIVLFFLAQDHLIKGLSGGRLEE